jgi:ectoine hydroxylase-related dioxygenase (phytanoyl-CoA dioxygenase family)
LEAMLAVRLHLDDCGPDNGPLRVIPGSHRLGRLRRDQIAACRQEIEEVVCNAQAGAALLLRPLLLHASSPARTPSHRRVIHIEFAPRCFTRAAHVGPNVIES